MDKKNVNPDPMELQPDDLITVENKMGGHNTIRVKDLPAWQEKENGYTVEEGEARAREAVAKLNDLLENFGRRTAK